MIRRPPRSPLFPSPPLFRSLADLPAANPAAEGRSFLLRPVAVTGDPTRDIDAVTQDRKSTRLNSSHSQISYAVFCLKKKKDHLSLVVDDDVIDQPPTIDQHA